MRYVRPRVYMIAKTKVIPDTVSEWLKSIGCDEDTVHKFANEDDEKTPGEMLIELAGRRCYMAFKAGLNPNVTRIREDIKEYIDNIFRSGHGSVLEHYYVSFALEYVSRVLTAELNRHRAGMAISEGSMRFILFTDLPFIEAPMLYMTPEEIDEAEEMLASDPQYAKTLLSVKKLLTRQSQMRVCEVAEKEYAVKQEIWKAELAPESKFAAKKHVTSMMRRDIPIGVGTGGIWTGNVRAVRHLLNMRCSEAAEEEILMVAVMILKKMMEEEPVLFGDFTVNDKGFWTPKYPKV